jgi:hypothetical protein
MKHYTNNNNNNNNATDFNHDMRKFKVGLYLFCIVTKQELQRELLKLLSYSRSRT